MSTRYSARGYGRDFGRYDREDYGGRYGRGPEYDYERDYAGREGRDFSERAGDEVRSWLGDDEAARRRRMDEGRGWREGYGSDYGRSSASTGRSSASTGLEAGAGGGSILIRLGDTDFDIAGEDDIRGRRVIDEAGNDIGDVDDLIVDERRRRARFLQVTSGGFLGIGGTMLLVPVEAITNVGRDEIMVSRRGGRGTGALHFNPALTDRSEYGGYAARGRQRGRGPRGYKRSDDRIREDINDRLADDPIIDASDIEVSIADAEVTLSGTVNSRADKRRAEDLAELVSGVVNVQNNLRVKRGELGATTDTAASTTTGTTTGIASGAAAGTTSGTTATGTRRGTAAGSATG